MSSWMIIPNRELKVRCIQGSEERAALCKKSRTYTEKLRKAQKRRMLAEKLVDALCNLVFGILYFGMFALVLFAVSI